MAKIFSIKVTETFDFGFDDKRFTVKRDTWPKKDWAGRADEDWTVIGGGIRHHVCDPEGQTHKRVVKALKAALAEAPQPIQIGEEAFV